jgi:hypothetical protein
MSEYSDTVKIVRAAVDEWLTQNYGERCDDFEFTCACCQRWMLADLLFQYERTKDTLLEEIVALEESCK